MTTTIITPPPLSSHPVKGPSLDSIHQAQQQLKPYINATPLYSIQTDIPTPIHSTAKELRIKLELWQKTGTFKIRSALLHVQKLAHLKKDIKVVALSGGNHALAVSYACHLYHIPTTVIMPKYASPLRIQACRDFNATVLLEDNLTDCFKKEEEYKQQGFHSIHPFEGPLVATGTGTLGLELLQQWPECDIVISAIGGGGLCSGIAHAIHLIKPNCKIYGVEPSGANAMSQSFIEGTPIPHIDTDTIADSLAAPCSLPYSFSLCQQHIAGIANITNTEVQQAMKFSFEHFKLALEPAAATTIAALHGPLKDICANKNVILLACGSNIDTLSYFKKLNHNT
jgi:threonine dehydratase